MPVGKRPSQFQTYQKQVAGLQESKDSPLQSAILGSASGTQGAQQAATTNTLEKAADFAKQTGEAALKSKVQVNPDTYKPGGTAALTTGTTTEVPTLRPVTTPEKPKVATITNDLQTIGGMATDYGTAITNVKKSVTQSGADVISAIESKLGGDLSAIASALGVDSAVQKRIDQGTDIFTDLDSGQQMSGRTLGEIGAESETERTTRQTQEAMLGADPRSNAAILAALGVSGAAGDIDPAMAALLGQVYHGELQATRGQAQADVARMGALKGMSDRAVQQYLEGQTEGQKRVSDYKESQEKLAKETAKIEEDKINQQVESAIKDLDKNSPDFAKIYEDSIKGIADPLGDADLNQLENLISRVESDKLADPANAAVYDRVIKNLDAKRVDIKNRQATENIPPPPPAVTAGSPVDAALGGGGVLPDGTIVSGAQAGTTPQLVTQIPGQGQLPAPVAAIGQRKQEGGRVYEWNGTSWVDKGPDVSTPSPVFNQLFGQSAFSAY